MFANFYTWNSYSDLKPIFLNTVCWYSGKDTGLPPRRPQFESHSQQAFLQKALSWKFFKKWLSQIWKLFEVHFKIHYS